LQSSALGKRRSALETRKVEAQATARKQIENAKRLLEEAQQRCQPKTKSASQDCGCTKSAAVPPSRPARALTYIIITGYLHEYLKVFVYSFMLDFIHVSQSATLTRVVTGKTSGGVYFRNKCFRDRKENPSANKLWIIGTVLSITITTSMVAYIMDEP
jgi:hypothetical protein